MGIQTDLVEIFSGDYKIRVILLYVYVVCNHHCCMYIKDRLGSVRNLNNHTEALVFQGRA